MYKLSARLGHPNHTEGVHMIRNTLFFIILILTTSLLPGCSYSDKDVELIDKCIEDYSQGIQDVKTGMPVNVEPFSDIYMDIQRACSTKVKMHQEGLRIAPLLESGDFQVYMYSGQDGFRRYLNKKLSCESDPDKC